MLFPGCTNKGRVNQTGVLLADRQGLGMEGEKMLVNFDSHCPEAEWVVQFSSAAQLCPTLCDQMDCSTPGSPVHHQLQELAQTYVHRVGDAIQPSHPSSVIPFSFCLQYFPASGSFPMSQFFASGGQSIGISVSASVSMNIQD